MFKNCICIFLCLFILGCRESYDEPIISLEKYSVEKGFNLELIASEPLIESPVAIDFDKNGRIWVVEMSGYMRDVDGNDEKAPIGAIKILEDLDEDGIMDHAKPFLDSLVLPRAIALVYGGLLYAEPPNLWFVEIENDKPGKRILVDPNYAAADGNPELQPNGLLLNIDNWIYSANSQYRYRRKQGNWLKEPTSFRGQWGISNDDFGRLYYNNNATQLSGDYMLPNLLVRNKHYKPKVGIYQPLTEDQRVYPLKAVPVNRGYMEGVLNKDSMLVKVTAACGPLIYRGDTYPKAYNQNAFVCVPEANLIKRNILTFNGDHISANQAWQGKEFLATTDESFRPVNLSNGPDGNMYVVDMHRGVIQHQAFMSPYLRKIVKSKKLDTIINCGRILKIRADAVENTPFNNNLDELSVQDLIQLLKHENGWLRDKAQHYLIYNNIQESIPLLKELVLNNKNKNTQAHALYTLEGLDALSTALLLNILKNSGSELACHTIALLSKFQDAKNALAVSDSFKRLLKYNDLTTDLYISAEIGGWLEVSIKDFVPIYKEILKRHAKAPIFQEAFASGLGKTTDATLIELSKLKFAGNEIMTAGINKCLENRKSDNINAIYLEEKVDRVDKRTKGANLYRQHCVVCHGISGEGNTGLAPPLMNSEYMYKPESLGLIILHGLKGPIHVNGNLYEMGHPMPGFKRSKDLSNEDIADVIAYVTSAFSKKPQRLSNDKIEELRNEFSKSGFEYTEEELLKIE
ncbi:dehydrogenase [Flavobacteriaceae bacterium MHTCC 0001]